MATNTVYKGPEGDTTQWDDIQRKLGNLPPKTPVWKPEAYAPQPEEARDAGWLDKKEEQELSDLEDDLQDDRFLEEYRQRRLQEMREASARPRFGALEDIGGTEFVARVTEASREHWVVLLLHKPAHAACQLLGACLLELAQKHPGTAFLRIVSTSCIPNYPDQNLPTVLLYRNGACAQTLVGLQQFGGARAAPEQVALVLNGYGDVCGGREGEDEEQRARSQVRGLVRRLVEAREERQATAHADEDSDFD